MPEKILLVDDERIIRMALKKNISKSGYDIDTCENGEQALDLLAQHAYDLLLTDYLMEGMNGCQLISKAMEMQHELKTILISGYKDLSFSGENDEQCAPDRILNKPIELDALLACIASLLDN